MPNAVLKDAPLCNLGATADLVIRPEGCPRHAAAAECRTSLFCAIAVGNLSVGPATINGFIGNAKHFETKALNIMTKRLICYLTKTAMTVAFPQMLTMPTKVMYTPRP